MTNSVIFSNEPEDFRYMETAVPCQKACPACTNIPAYIRALYDKDYDRSCTINHQSNIFPGVLGRICSRPCEAACRHGEPGLGQPVNICHIKRAAADYTDIELKSCRSLGDFHDTSVAVIGAGPAGLAAAHDLAVAGCSVTVYEAFDQPGGMLRYGIPEFRLPREVLQMEINRLLGLGIKLETGVRVGKDLLLDELLHDHSGVLVAAGCYRPNRLEIPGEDLDGVHFGLDFMVDVCQYRPPPMGKRVLVIGTGFTAFDCARSALRCGADESMICLPYTEHNLSVTPDEIMETKIEGVTISALMLSRRIVGNNRVEGVEFVRTRPGATSSRNAVPIEGSEYFEPADTVIVAIGQRREPILEDLNGSSSAPAPGTVSPGPSTHRCGTPKLYITGDYRSGPSTVIEAIADGRVAASAMVRDLLGSEFRQRLVRIEEAEITHRKRVWDFLPRQTMPTMEPVNKRRSELRAEVETGFAKNQAHEEAKRCYLCFLHYEIDIERCIYCRYCLDVAPRDCIKLVSGVTTDDNGAITGYRETTSWRDVNAVIIDNSRCIRCGECARICPMDCISVSRVELVEEPLTEQKAEGAHD